MKFYMTYSRSRPDSIVTWVEENDVPIMTSAMHRWSENTEQFLGAYEYETGRVIDSGGYSVLAAYEGYPWTVDQYHSWLSENRSQFHWAAIMDYPCEERFDELLSVDERVDMTIENAVAHFEKNPDYKLLPVIQGRSVEKYVECYERMEDLGIPMDHIGVGTVCRLSNTQEIVNVESQLRDRIDAKMHGFGVKINAIKAGVSFDSMDSHAWAYAPSNGKIIRTNGSTMKREPMPNDSKTRTVESFKNYYRHVQKMPKQSRLGVC